MPPEQATLEAYAEKLVSEKGLEGLDPEVKAQVEKDLVDRAEDRINAMIVASMPQEKLAEFNALLEKDDDQATRSFCLSVLPDLDARIGAELASFRETYLNG